MPPSREQEFEKIAAIKTRAAISSAMELTHALQFADRLGPAKRITDVSDSREGRQFGHRRNQRQWPRFSLPDRDYYLKDDEHSKSIRDEFVTARRSFDRN